MTYERSILNSNPSPELKRLLDSAVLDVPTSESKARTRAMALLALRQRQVGSTTQLSAFALGETVNRLVGAVTLSNRKVSSFHLALRGTAVGVLVGAAALAVIATGRWLTRPTSDLGPTVATLPVATSRPPEVVTQLPASTEVTPFDETAFRDAQTRLHAGDPNGALTRLDEAERLGNGDGAVKRPLPFVLLRLRCLAALGRTADARALADRTIQATEDPRVASEVKAVLESLPAARP